VKSIEVVDVSKSFAHHHAIENISFSIEEGHIFGLLGPNGAGKTTLIRILNQIFLPDTGQVFLNEKPLQHADIGKIGYLPEERGLYKKMKVGEQVLYFARLHGVPKTEALKQIYLWFEKFDLMARWNCKIEELSKGMQQKVQFVLTMIHNPDFLIFDEPFSGLDPVNALLFKDEILSAKRQGKTIVLSTHDMSSVEEICDDILLVHKSREILKGNLHEIKQRFNEHLFSVNMNATSSTWKEKLPNSFQVVSEQLQRDYTRYTFKITDHGKGNLLLDYLLAHANIYAFQELLPSMNDIFIAMVKRESAR
jgi:ABC-2 type transport system ATP-binding protein